MFVPPGGGPLPSVTSGEPLLAFVRRHLDGAGRITDEGQRLPDDARPDLQVWFAPGSFDGIFSQHAGDETLRDAESIADLVIRAGRRPARRRLRALHDALVDADALSVADPLLDELTRRGADIDEVRRIGLWLASTSPNRNPVKIGLALLGVTRPRQHLDVIRTLGAHDEFTLFAATALVNGVEESESALWALAISVTGWGRVQCVERLRDTQDPQIRTWLLREGYKNSVLYEYTAYVAADTGGLLAALDKDTVDRPLLTAAGEILTALISEGPARDIDDYADGADAIERFLTVMRSRADTLTDYQAVAAIRDFLGDDDRFTIERPGWSVTRREGLHAASKEILGQPHWQDAVTARLTPDAVDDEYSTAVAVASDLGIDTFEVSVARIERDPLGSGWYHAWQAVDSTRAQRLVDLARARLPLAEIASGPVDKSGLGPEDRPHRALGHCLRGLQDHLGLGSACCSPVYGAR